MCATAATSPGGWGNRGTEYWRGVGFRRCNGMAGGQVSRDLHFRQERGLQGQGYICGGYLPGE